MEAQSLDAIPSMPRVRVTLRLGSENYCVNAENGILSEQLMSVKEQSMSILKEYITRHNVPNDVPDEPLEGSSDDDDAEVPVKPPKLKKTK